MLKAKKYLLSIIITILLLNLAALLKPVLAAVPKCTDIRGFNIQATYNLSGNSYTASDIAQFPNNTSAIFFKLSGPFTETASYRLYFGWAWAIATFTQSDHSHQDIATSGSLNLAIDNPRLLTNSYYWGTLQQKNSSGVYEDYCEGINYTAGTSYTSSTCKITLNPSTPTLKQTVTANISRAPRGEYDLAINYSKDPNDTRPKTVKIDPDGNASFTFMAPATPKTDGTIELFFVNPNSSYPYIVCTTQFNTTPTSNPATQAPVCTISPTSPTIFTEIAVIATNITAPESYYAKVDDTTGTKLTTNPIAVTSGTTTSIPLTTNGKFTDGSYAASVYKQSDNSLVCKSSEFRIGSSVTPGIPAQQPSCLGNSCTKTGSIPCGAGDNGIRTAIGCIRTKPAEFVADFMTFAIGISGGLAFLMMLLGAFQMITSGGNPDSLNNGKTRLTSAIIGLLFVIFATLLMQIIGVDILFKGLPGFGR